MSESHSLLAGRYRLLRRLGAGGMGVVWHAWDERLRRPVAVKQLHAQRGMTEAETAVASERAMREARINARLHHPHAVSVFDVVEHDGQPCLIMQYLPSRGLDTILAEQGGLPPREAARIGAQVAAALAAAHEAGIVHRDVKPGNILLTEDGTARISDFGISRAVWDVTLTSTGMVTGTPAYLSPEVARGEPSSFPSDVFSLGATLYAAVEGVPPFGASDNPMALLHQVASGRHTPPIRAGELTPILERMLAPAPQDRPPMEEVALALDAVSGTSTPYAAEPVEPPPRRRTLHDVPAAAAVEQAATATPAPPVATAAPAPPVATRTRVAAPGRGRAFVAGLATLLVLAAALTVFLVSRGNGGSAAPTADGQPAPASGPASASVAPRPSQSRAGAFSVPPVATQPASATPPRPSTTASMPASTTASTPASTPAPASPPRTASATTTPSPAASVPPGSLPTAAELAQAITGYYGLMPGNTDAGWSRLTPAYQRTTAGNRQTYDAFWRAISRVAVSGATGAPPSAAQATVTYTFTDGRVVRERTAYRLVRDGGVLKIDRSSVLNSQQL